LLALAALVASAAVGRAALPDPQAAPATPTLTGQLLVAEPDIGDPRFRHAVILLVRHGEDGAFGIVVNRPLGEQSWASLLESTGQDTAGAAGSVRLYSGGPVEPARGFVLHSADYHGRGTVDIDSHVAMTPDPAVLRAIANHVGPQKSLIAFGYAGWAPGQLEHELALHGWFTIPDDPKLLFDEDRDKVWDAAVARRTIPL
jgi:putative transcriptional regulator